LLDPTNIFFSVAESGNFSRIPDPTFFYIGSGSASKNLSIFLTQKTDTKFSKIRSGMFIPDFDFFPSRIPDHPGAKKAPDPEFASGSASLIFVFF
jgi:hypothetical protein